MTSCSLAEYGCKGLYSLLRQRSGCCTAMPCLHGLMQMCAKTCWTPA